MHFINKAQENAFMTLRLEVHTKAYPGFPGLTVIVVVWPRGRIWVDSSGGII